MVKDKMKICQCCKGNEESDSSHLASPLHKFNFLLWNWNKNKKSLVKNRHNVEVTISTNDQPLNHDVNNGIHSFKITPSDLLKRKNKIDFKCTVANKRNDDSIFLTYANVLYQHTFFTFHGTNNNSHERSIEVKPGKMHSIIVRFGTGESILIGNYKIPVCFSIKTIRKKTDYFNIVRTINISVEDLLAPTEISESPFKGTPWKDITRKCPPTRKELFHDRYKIQYRKFLFHQFEEFKDMKTSDTNTLADLRRQMDPGNVTRYNYKEFWHLVLWLEEIKQEHGLQQYNMDNVSLKLIDCDQLELLVPGLAEKRPSVIRGDMIDIRIHDDNTRYQGIIVRVNETTVEIGNMDPEFFSIMETFPQYLEKLDVKFVLSRLALERQHQGIDCVVNNKLLPHLFPQENFEARKIQYTRKIHDGDFCNPTIALNQEQKTAVLNILNVTSFPYPYIIFGPPGTGKTVTVVEAILQIKKKTTHNILICAPSNAACDVVTEKLLPHCHKDELLRIISETVDISTIHKIVLPFTNYEGDGVFKKIVPEDLPSYRIVVTTLILAGRFTGKYNPDVVFIDEAAQASEPEACCALGLITKGKQIILAGDPKQLGPSLSSDAAKKYGLGISLLERLMACDIYDRHDSNYITMLVQNFRNHSIILEIPNELFYKGRLQARSASDIDPISKIFVFTKIQELYKKQINGCMNPSGQPVEFCYLISEESKEGKSPSYFNTWELQMTLKYIQALLSLKFKDKSYSVLQSDIGIVTPYIRQVHKLKGLLQKQGFGDIEVGTTETFQGREKRIIIISTVRARANFLAEDKKFKLGFVNNEKRFNVAITRAMSKLVVIGCAHVLATDKNWLKFIEFCIDLKGFCGAPFFRRTGDFITDVTQKIQNVKADTQYNPENKII